MERQAILERLGWQFIRIRGSAFYRNPDIAMRSVFDRLGELEIPPESNVDEPQASDMTLIHELEDLIRTGFGSDAPLMEVAAESSEDEKADDLFSISMTEPASFDHGQVEALLGELGGSASLATFLRDYAKSKGFQRLGRNVRKDLETELEMLARKGIVEIKSGMIRLI
jgi:hypothetical protein